MPRSGARLGWHCSRFPAIFDPWRLQMTDDLTPPYATELGHRLREIRQQQGLSLHGVQAKSGDRWKAVVIGSYERGDRSITAHRLAELADFYGVPMARLLPGTDSGQDAPPVRRRLMLDL